MEWLIAPVTIVVIVTIFIVIFRTPIIRMIGRIKKLGKGGFELDTEQSKNEIQQSPTKTADDLIKGIDNQLIREIENEFKQHLDGMPDSEKIKALSRLFAASLWGYMATNTYRLIFGSQIAALEFLNSHHKVPRDSLRPFYAAAANRHPDFYQNYSYDQWLGFLESQVLILYDADLIGVTVRGQEFLQHLVRDKLSKVKAG